MKYLIVYYFQLSDFLKHPLQINTVSSLHLH